MTTRVTVAILTYRRPRELAACLPLVVQQSADLASRPDEDAEVEVVVIDNDPAETGRPVVEALADPLVRYVVEEFPGISAGRNRAIDEGAGSDLVVFIDDDEQPEPKWLDTLFGVWLSTGAAAVVGRVISKLPDTLDPWVESGRFFSRQVRTTGARIPIAATNNTLIDLHHVRRHGLRFDTALGLSGGEDNLFSRQLIASGGEIVWSNEALVTDVVPPERTTRRWVLTRAWSNGNTAIVVDLRFARDRRVRLQIRAFAILRGLFRLTGGSLRFGFGLVIRSAWHQARGLRTALRGSGMIAAAFGVVHQEYAREPRRSPLKRTLRGFS